MATVDFNDDITLDEDKGLQTSGIPNLTEDNNDDDIVWDEGLPQDFIDRLIVLQGGTVGTDPLTAFFPGDSIRGPEAAMSSTDLTVSGTGKINNIAFTDEDGNPLDGTVDSGLRTLDGERIMLYTDTNDNIVYGYIEGTSTLAFAAYLDETTNNQTGSITGATLYMVTFTAIKHPDPSTITDPLINPYDDPVSILQDTLFVTAFESIEFDLSTLASGQNDWNWFGDQTDPATSTSYQIIVIADTLGQTVNTSKGGGDTTIGNSNQLMNGIDPGKDVDGEAMVFTFVKNSATELLAGDLGDIDTVDFDELQNANRGQWSISQTQGGAPYAVATMSAWTTTKETMTSFFPGIGDAEAPATVDDVQVRITTVSIYDADPKTNDPIYVFTYTGDFEGGTVTSVSFDEPRTVGKGKNADTFDVVATFYDDGSVQIEGLIAKDYIQYETDGDHNRLILQNTGIEGEDLPWDIGGFSLLDAGKASLDVGPKMIIEDAGLIVPGNGLGEVHEDALKTVLSTGITEEGEVQVTKLTGDLGGGLSAGVDQPITFKLVDSSGPTLTSKNESLSYEVTFTDASGSDPAFYTLTATAGSGTSERVVFTFKVTTTGSFEFELFDQLDHSAAGDPNPDEVTLTVNLTEFIEARDADGDLAALDTDFAAIVVENDVPEASGETETATVIEDDLSTLNGDEGDASEGIGDETYDGDETSGSVAPLVTSGADDPAEWSFSTDTSLTGALDALGLTSQGDAVTWSVDADGNTLTATADALGTPRTILTVELSSDGGYTVDLDDQFDHDVDLSSATLAYYTGDGPSDDPDLKVLNIDLSALLVAEDFDGDTVSPNIGAFVLGIENDVPEASGETETATVIEDDLSTLNGDEGDASEGIGDETYDGDETSGSVAPLVTSGADDPAEWSFSTDTSLTGALDALGLTSQGDAVTWSVDADGNTLTATADALGTPRTILTVELSSDGGYTVDLDDQFDHDVDLSSATLAYYTGDGPSDDPDLKVLNIDLSALLVAEDFDGDTVSPNIGAFVLGIENDVPEASGETETATVIEDDLSTLNGDEGDASEGIGDETYDGDETSGSVAPLVTSGADDPAEWSFSTDTSLTGALDALGLTSQGDAVTWSVDADGNTLTATADALGTPRTILTVELSSDGGYTVDLDDQFDHDVDLSSATLAYYTGDGPSDDPDLKVLNIDLSALLVAEDFDGDTVSPNTGAFVLGIENDVPEASGETETATVIEDDLSTLNGDEGDASEGIGDETYDGDETSGSVAPLVTSGADDPAEWSFSTDTSLTGALDALGLTSQGDAVTWSVDADGNTLTATADALGTPRTILTVELSSDGGYTVDLDDQFDHAVADDTLYFGSGDSAYIELDLSALLEATDFDGDSATPDTGSFKLRIENDVPVIDGEAVSGRVEEDELNTALSTGITDGDVFTTVATGSVDPLVSDGADEDVTWKLKADTSGIGSYTSKGSAISWTTNADGTLLTGSTADGRDVFTLALTAAGGYTATLLDQFDHTSGSGDDGFLTIDFSSVLEATDFDGDSVSVGAGLFTIVVENDVPVDNTNTVQGAVVEDGLATALSTGIGGGLTTTGSALAGIGTLQDLVTSGADEPVTWSLDEVTTAVDSGFDSKGQDILITSDGSTLTGTAGTRVVYTLTVGDTGTWSFTLYDQVDHVVGSTVNDDSEFVTLDFSSYLIATDFDGDTVTEFGTNALSVKVENDVPDYTNGVEEPTAPIPFSKSSPSFTGNLNGAVGADDDPTYTFVGTPTVTTDPSTVTGVAGLTGTIDPNSSGTRAVWYVDDDGTEGYSSGDTEYFQAVINTDGTYTFTVLEDPNPPELTFDFDGFPAGNQIYGAFGPNEITGTSGATVSVGLLVIPDGIDLKANGTLNNSNSTTLNSSKSDGSTTALAVSNNSIDSGEALNFVSVGDLPSDIVVGQDTFIDGNYKDGDTLSFGELIERNGASFEVAQTTPTGSLVDIKVTAIDLSDSYFVSAGGGIEYLEDPDLDYPPNPTSVAEAVQIETVTVYDAPKDSGGKIIAYFVLDAAGTAFVLTTSPDDDDPDDNISEGDMEVSIHGDGIKITNIADDFEIAWTHTEGADLWKVENVDGEGDGLDIGGFNFSQSQPTPDHILGATVRLTDADFDYAEDTFQIIVDGTGIYEGDNIA